MYDDSGTLLNSCKSINLYYIIIVSILLVNTSGLQIECERVLHEDLPLPVLNLWKEEKGFRIKVIDE